jgi:hypothetical protein
MKRIAVMLLLVGAVLGLVAQAPARALAPPLDAQTVATMASMPDCMAAMERSNSHKPCDCSRADCIAAMLGAAPFFTVADADRSLLKATVSSIRPQSATVAPLAGRDVGPEPDPPNSLI